MWDEIGLWQFELLTGLGLQPEHRLLDIGCGTFRGGVKFVDYLESGNYFGTDLRQELIDAGYEREIEPAGLAPKLPRENLSATGDFEAPDKSAGFDYALAVSVFTHLPWNDIRLGLVKISCLLVDRGCFVFTIFECPSDAPWSAPLRHEPGSVVSKPTADPYHYRFVDLAHAVADLPVTLQRVEFRRHPRGQVPLVMRRVEG